jgi:ATP-binding cassette subfamily F protein uup
MLFISHDRHFINLFADRIFEIRDSRFREYRGNYDDYLANMEKEEPQKVEKTASDKKPSRGREKRKADFTIRKTEDDIKKLEDRIKETDRQIQKNATDYEKLTELTEKRSDLLRELEKLYEKWMEATYD